MAKLFPASQDLLKMLVETANRVGSADFHIIQTFGGDTAIFGMMAGSERVNLEMPKGVYSTLEGTEFIELVSRDRRRLSAFAFDGVANNFAPPPPPKLASPAQTNIVHNYGSIGTLNQLNVNAEEKHAAADALSVLRELLAGLPADVAKDAGDQIDAIESELGTPVPSMSKAMAYFLAAGMMLKEYGPPLTALMHAAHEVKLDKWLGAVLGMPTG